MPTGLALNRRCGPGSSGDSTAPPAGGGWTRHHSTCSSFQLPPSWELERAEHLRYKSKAASVQCSGGSSSLTIGTAAAAALENTTWKSMAGAGAAPKPAPGGLGGTIGITIPMRHIGTAFKLPMAVADDEAGADQPRYSPSYDHHRRPRASDQDLPHSPGPHGNEHATASGPPSPQPLHRPPAIAIPLAQRLSGSPHAATAAATASGRAPSTPSSPIPMPAPSPSAPARARRASLDSFCPPSPLGRSSGWGPNSPCSPGTYTSLLDLPLGARASQGDLPSSSPSPLALQRSAAAAGPCPSSPPSPMSPARICSRVASARISGSGCAALTPTPPCRLSTPSSPSAHLAAAGAGAGDAPCSPALSRLRHGTPLADLLLNKYHGGAGPPSPQ